MDGLLYVLLGLALALAVFVVTKRTAGFLSQSPGHYENLPGEAFDLRKHLNGPILCEGVIYGPLGKVTSRFVGYFDAQWDGTSGVMKERFVYDSGDVQERAWYLNLGSDGAIRATAEDVVGTGKGWQRGAAVQLKYNIRLPEDAGGHVLSAVDWMYLTPNGTIVNRSQFRKFGIKVAELVATMRREETT